MPKTTKGDWMERRAKKYLGGYEGTMTYALQVHKLTRLLRKVAREAARRERKSCINTAMYIICTKGNRVMHPVELRMTIADAIRNRRSA